MGYQSLGISPSHDRTGSATVGRAKPRTSVGAPATVSEEEEGVYLSGRMTRPAQWKTMMVGTGRLREGCEWNNCCQLTKNL